MSQINFYITLCTSLVVNRKKHVNIYDHKPRVIINNKINSTLI